MGFKTMIDIKGELYDLWEVRTIQRYSTYDEFNNEQKFYIQLNREGKGTNAENILILCDNEDDMNTELAQIKIKLNEDDNIEII